MKNSKTPVIRFILFSIALSLLLSGCKQGVESPLDRTDVENSMEPSSTVNESHPYYKKLQKAHEMMMGMSEDSSMSGMPMPKEKIIAVLLYDGFNQLDATGPLESLVWIDGAKIVTVAKKKGTIVSDEGIKMTADYNFSELKSAYILVIPGGLMGTIEASLDNETLEWIKQIDKTTTYTTSVCTGAWILGSTGLIEGRNAATQWSGAKFLEDLGVNYSGQRYTFDGKYVTSAGVTSGIDMGLALLGKIEGDDAAKAAQLVMEYDPQPPYDSGSPSKADPELVKIMDKMMDDHTKMAAGMK